MTPAEQMLDDANYWQLTRHQRLRYFARIMRYWADKAAYERDRAEHHSRYAILLAGIACGTALGTLVGRLLLAVLA